MPESVRGDESSEPMPLTIFGDPDAAVKMAIDLVEGNKTVSLQTSGGKEITVVTSKSEFADVLAIVRRAMNLN